MKCTSFSAIFLAAALSACSTTGQLKSPPAPSIQQLKPQTQNHKVLLALQLENPTKSPDWILDQFILYLMLKDGGL